MIDLGQDHPQYVSSAILSKMIKRYNDHSAELTPFLKETTNFTEIRTDDSITKTMQEVYKKVQPLIVHIRPGAMNPNKLGEEITSKLSAEHGFVNLDVNKCISGEHIRGTYYGQEFEKYIKASKVIPAKLIVGMLNRIIYCGQPDLNKFILSNFPDVIEQAEEFEKNCSEIAAIIYPAPNTSTVEIKDNMMQTYNIDTMFQKGFKLQTMNEWNWQLFNEKLGNKVNFGVVTGEALSGKSTISKHL